MATNSTEAIAELYASHHNWLNGWLRKKVGCSEQAADLAHDTFIRLIGGRNIREFREPRGYLTTIAKGLMVDMFRRKAIERAYLDALRAYPEPLCDSPESRAIVIETLYAVDHLLDQLGMRTRAVFLMAQLEGLTQIDIARTLDISLPTVRKHLVRAYTECLLMGTK